MARVHPGETVSSFVVKGFLDGLFSEVSEAQYLRSKLSVKVIPMQNPDGVIHGNTRTSVIGNDLNRRWILPSETMHPEIFCIKKYIQELEREGVKIFGMIDLHGHTKKESSFFYGCCAKKNQTNHYKVRLLNYLMGNCDKNFKSEFSSFYVGSSKRSTARVTFFNEFCDFSYTLESTFMSAHENMLHYSIKDYEDIGKNLLKSVAHLRETINPT